MAVLGSDNISHSGNFKINVNSADRVTVDTNGVFTVGPLTTTRQNFFNSTFRPTFQLEGTTGSSKMASIISSESVGGGGALILGKQKSGTLGGTTAVVQNDEIGRCSFQGFTGTNFVSMADIIAYADGTVSSTSAPGKLSFFTTDQNSVSPVERFVIFPNGTCFVPSGSGFQFGNWASGGAISSGNDLVSRYNNTGSFRRSLVVASDNALIINFSNDHGKVVMGGGLTMEGSTTHTVSNYGFLTNSASTGFFAGSQTVGSSVDARSGRVLALEFNATSDRRLKKDVSEIPDHIALSFLYNVKPVSFKWNEHHPSHGEGNHRIGYIAQDVIKSGFPNLVAFGPAGEDATIKHNPIDEETGLENPQDAFFTLNYDDASVLTHRALQIAFKRIEELTEKVQKLENLQSK